jgi:hypothetical protein
MIPNNFLCVTLREERKLRVFENRVLRVFENRVLRRIFGPKWDEVTEEWRKIHKYLYSSPTTLRMIKSRRMRWARHEAHMGNGRGVYMVWVGKSEGKRHWGDSGVDGRIILRWIFRKLDMGAWTGLS